MTFGAGIKGATEYQDLPDATTLTSRGGYAPVMRLHTISGVVDQLLAEFAQQEQGWIYLWKDSMLQVVPANYCVA